MHTQGPLLDKPLHVTTKAVADGQKIGFPHQPHYPLAAISAGRTDALDGASLWLGRLFSHDFVVQGEQEFLFPADAAL
jgi:hypothetical protein